MLIYIFQQGIRLVQKKLKFSTEAVFEHRLEIKYKL